MNNKFEFYKEFYFKELDVRNEINNSLSLPIGLISGLVAGVFYLLTNFDCKCSTWLTVLFGAAIIAALIFLVVSIYHLIKAYSDFPKGYDYNVLPDINDIEDYRQQLTLFYDDITSTEMVDKEMSDYILSEMISNTGGNQKNNKRKMKYRYNCEKYLITSFIMVCISLPFFCFNYVLKP
jgi:hypothetical protein